MIEAANIPQLTLAGPGSNKPLLAGVKGRMPARLALLLLILAPIHAFSQYGINARYLSGNSGTGISQKGFQAGLEYYFRLKSNRVEFHPMLGYRRSFESEMAPGYYSSIDLDFNAAFYLFDFEGDCNCPTFSKQGTLVKKGFFFELQPGVGYQTITLQEAQSSNMVVKLGIAAGLDIGISDQYTMTPFISGTRIFAGEWEALTENGLPGKMDDFFVFGAGIRLSHTSGDIKRGHRY
jgi:hypothetical protein